MTREGDSFGADRTPPTRRGAQVRDRIIDAAADLVFARGAARTNLDDVRAATATSKSQLYHYFRDKDDLIRAVITRQTERVLDAQRPDLDALDSFAALTRWRNRIVELQRERHCAGGCPIGSLASELSDVDDTARTDLAGSFAHWHSYLESGLTAMRRRGTLRADANPKDLATAVMTALQGGLLLAQNSRSTRPLEIALDMALRHVRAYRSGS
ncbi:MAG TPA: TetR family transcriptional regulator C-terminal domain-containing protein [Jatrophihabitantaceae bacterium]|jgi:AcrR family transcriptional regulator